MLRGTHDTNGMHGVAQAVCPPTELTVTISLQILASDTDKARLFIVSFLTAPKSEHRELRTKFQIYIQKIFGDPKFDPLFSYLAPLASESDILLSVWAFKNHQDVDVYMPVSLRKPQFVLG